MKIFLSPSNQDGNKYAYGNTNESVQCLKIAQACKEALERNGMEVMLMHDYSMSEKVAAANKWGADFYIPIHTNAYNGQVAGTRMFYYSENGLGHDMAKAIFNRLAPFTPGTSENIKQNQGLYETRNPNAWSVYIEVDFHDVPAVAKWIIENSTEIGEVIAHGICDFAGVSYKQKSDPAPDPDPSEGVWYKVQVGAFRNRQNAENLLRMVRNDYPDAYITVVNK